MKGKTRIIIVAALVVASFAYLVVVGMREGSMYYLEVSEFVEKSHEMNGRKVRINGEVVKGSMSFDPEALKLAFTLKDTRGRERLDVIYRGAPPDLMGEEGVTLVAEGSFDEAREVFVSKKLLVKCPSKYEKEDGGA